MKIYSKMCLGYEKVRWVQEKIQINLMCVILYVFLVIFKL